MNIVLVSQEYPPETARGGIGSQTYAKAKGFSARGHRVYVITRSLGERSETTEGNLTVIRIPGMEHQLYNMTEVVEWITHSSVVAAEIDALKRKIKPDLVDFPEWAAEGYVYLLNRTDWYSVPVVLQLHGPLAMFAQVLSWPEKTSSFYHAGMHMESTCVQLADAVYSSSACSTQWVKDHYHAGHKKIPTIHTGVDTRQFFPRPVPKSPVPTLIFVGKLVQNKGVEELIQAAGGLVKTMPAFQVWIYGRGSEEYTVYLQQMAKDNGVAEQVHFQGYIPKEQLAERLSMAHIFVGPSYYEGGPGFVYLEAMACGLPVIACSGSGVSEIVSDGYNGLLIPPGDASALQAALHKLMVNSPLLLQMGANALAYVQSEADSQYCLDQLEAFYLHTIKCYETRRAIVMPPAGNHERLLLETKTAV